MPFLVDIYQLNIYFNLLLTLNKALYVWMDGLFLWEVKFF